MAASHCIRCKAEIERAFKACPHCGEPVTDFLRRYSDEPVDGKYKIVERLGTGGMGEVYKVTHTFLGATRVIKVIRPQISESTDAHERFLREARAATKVQHPNVATLHDFSALPDGSHYMVWEYIDGENLAERIRMRGTLSPQSAVPLAIQALRGLEAIHRAGIIHRDISPENLMITREGGGEDRVKVIDMGVAKVAGSSDNATSVGVFVGKLRYASPEHLGFLPEGERIDERADLYSMGMVLYEMLAGRPPFEATSPHEYVMLHSRDTQFKPLDLPADLPGGAQLQAVLRRALERDRTKRFASAREFANALEQVEKSLPAATMNAPRPDEEDTWRVTPLPQSAAETVRTPLPSAMPPTIVARQESSSLGAIVMVAGIVIVAALAIALVLSRRPAQEPVATTTFPTQAPPSAPLQSQTKVDVVSAAPVPTTTTPPPAVAPTLAQPITTNSRPLAPAVVRNKPAAVERPRKSEPAPPLETKPAPAAPVRAYVEGGDSDVNDGILSELKRQLSGVRSVTVRASGETQKELTDKLKKEVSGVAIVDGADTVIDFDGVLERLGRGKKRRSAHASISKHGRVIFRYEMPPEEYRVGDTPTEAFVRVLADALQ